MRIPQDCARHRERGAGIVEMALVLPVLVLLIAGVMDFGIMLSDANRVRHGVRESARAATVADVSGVPECGALDDTEALVCFVRDRIDTEGALVKIEMIGPYQVGGSLRICVMHPLESISGLTSPFLDGRWSEIHVEMRIEQTFEELVEHEDPAPVATDWAWCA